MLVRCPRCQSVVADPTPGVPIQCPTCGFVMVSGPPPPGAWPGPGPAPGPGPPSGWQQGQPVYRVPPGRTPGAENPLSEVWGIFRKLAHAVVLLGIGSLMAAVVLDLLILLWGYWPVEEAALRGEARSVLFLIAPYPVGEASWTGAGALGLGTFLVAHAVALLYVNRSGRFPGLGGVGTRIYALLAALGGAGMLAWGAYLAVTGHLTSGVTAPNYLPTPIGLVPLRFGLLAAYHGFLVGAIWASFMVMLVKDAPPLLSKLRRGLPKGELPTVRTDNTWIVVPRMYLAILAFYILYFSILGLFQVEPTTPAFEEEPLWSQLHMFAEASVWEEVVSRILMLGLPLWIYHVLAGRVQRPLWRYAAGGGFAIENAAFVLVVAQALVFALAHVAGWDLWKVLPTTLSGLAFGYLFLRRGLFAAIMLHFTFDYLGLTVAATEEWGMSTEGAFNAIYLLWAAVGLVLLVHYAVVIGREGYGTLGRAIMGPGPEATGEG